MRNVIKLSTARLIKALYPRPKGQKFKSPHSCKEIKKEYGNHSPVKLYHEGSIFYLLKGALDKT